MSKVKAKVKPATTGTWNSGNTEAAGKASAATVKKVTRSKAAALAYLVRLGTHDENGNLTKKYRS